MYDNGLIDLEINIPLDIPYFKSICHECDYGRSHGEHDPRRVKPVISSTPFKRLILRFVQVFAEERHIVIGSRPTTDIAHRDALKQGLNRGL